MDLFRNRPFAFAVFSAVTVALAVTFINISNRWIFSVIFLICAVIFGEVGLVRHHCGKWQSIAILSCLLTAILLFGSWNFFERQVGNLEQYEGESVAAEGIILARISSGTDQSRFSMRLKTLNGKRVNQKVLLRCDYLSALRAGERVLLTGTTKAGQVRGDRDAVYYISEGFSGVFLCSSAQNCTVLSGGEKSLLVLLSEWNGALTEKLVARLGKREGGMAAALVLGNRSHLTQTDTLAFRRVGIAHFLALSGLHVGILIAAIERLLRLCRVGRKFRVWSIIGLSVFYLALTGASPSTVRAVGMATVLFAAFLLRRRYDSQTAIFAALFAILALQPYAIADSGLWLSFLAAGGIVVFVPAIRDRIFRDHRPQKAIHPVKRAGRALLLSVSVGLFAFSATLFLSALLFGEVSVLSVPATLVLSPLLSLALVFSALCLLLPIPPVFFLARKALWFLCRAASGLSEWRGITVRLQDRVTLILVMTTAVLLALCAILKLRRKWVIAVPLLLCVASLISAYLAVPSAKGETQITYFSQKSQEYLLFAKGGKAVAVDCSGGNKNDSEDLVNDLHEAYCTELEELIFTHYHTPSTYLLGRIAAKVKIRTLVLPIPQNEDEAAVAARISEEAALLGISCKTADESDAVAGLTLRWMHDEGMQEPAITVVAQTSKSCLVWCNSQFASAEQTQFFRAYASGANVFLFGQHGSTSGLRRTVPQLSAQSILVGEWKNGAIPFLPAEGTFYQTVSGKAVFSLS